MSTNAGTPRLPIVSLFNANPVWMRGSDHEVGDLSELKSSMAQEGLKVPVLVMPDYQVLDGARRLVVASELGWSEIPVVIAHGWDDVYEHFVATREAERDHNLQSLPMDLFALDRLILTLKGMYGKKQNAVSRASAAKARETGIKQPVRSVPLFEVYLAEMFGMKAPDIKVSRTIMASMRHCYAQSKELGDQARGHIEDYVRNGGRIWVLDALLLEMKGAKPATPTPRQLRTNSEPIRVKQAAVEPDPVKAKQQISVVSEVVRVLEDMGEIVRNLDPFNPAADVEELRQLQDRRRAALGKVNRLRSLLETPIKAKESENEK